jgi:hypothetical protein
MGAALRSALTALKTPSKPTHRVRAPTPLGWDSHGFVGFAGVRVSTNERGHQGPLVGGNREGGLRRSQNPKMSIQHDLAAVVSINGEITVDARLIAPDLGLTPEEMMAELRCGLVYQVAEKGTAADEGRIRLTFRYRARECRIVVDASGAVVG